MFGEQHKCRDRVRFLKELAVEVSVANETKSDGGIRENRVDQQIGWRVPSAGWYKLNMDGASRGNPGLAAAGGALRDSNGE